MKHTIPLKRFEYCMPDTATTHFQLAKVNIDFEKGSLSLEGDVKVNATIYPGVRVRLSHVADEEFVFSLEGIIEDGNTINTCCGLLVLDSMKIGMRPAAKNGMQPFTSMMTTMMNGRSSSGCKCALLLETRSLTNPFQKYLWHTRKNA